MECEMPSDEPSEAWLDSLVRGKASESLSLEFKSGAALKNDDKCKNDMSKDASAFANSAGGRLVYGLAENPASHVAERVDGVDPKECSREWLEQVINSRIQRRIDGIRVRQVELPRLAPGRVCYVVDVPQSLRAPHMAFDHRYYKRFEFQAVPMEEYEVRDVARRQEAPALTVQFVLTDWPGVPGDAYLLALKNESDAPCAHAVVTLTVHYALKFAHAGALRNRYSSSISGVPRPLPVRVYELAWSAADSLPAFRGHAPLMTRQPFVIDLARSGEGAFYIQWQVVAPRTDPREGHTFYVNKTEGEGRRGFGINPGTFEMGAVLGLPDMRWPAEGEVINHD